MSRLIDEEGKRYGKLLVVGRDGNGLNGGALWLCLCDCGQLTHAVGYRLRSGKKKSCGCLQKEFQDERRRNGDIHGQAKNGKESLCYKMWAGSKSRAKKHGLPFDLQLEDIIPPHACPVLGMKLETERGGEKRARQNAPSLDRFHPDAGYTKNNVRIISRRANTIKNNATTDELLAVAGYCMGVPDRLSGWADYETDWADLK